jgi:DNA-3-methyladenine glycosylase I
MVLYHDTEWGVPVHNDKKLFEFLVLESAQAGLSWKTILHRRNGYKKAFAHFDYKKVAKFGSKDVARLMKDTGIIRNKLKILATIRNAQKFIEIQKEFGSFHSYMWKFVGNKQIDGKRKKHIDIPAITPESIALAKDLKKRGFTFLGPTITYAHMQAVGMVNDHTTQCFRYKECKKI